jgi:predicted nucleotidyltransferase
MMETPQKPEIEFELPTIMDHPALLWLRQHARRLGGKALLQEEIMNAVVSEAIADQNIIGILLFGSLLTRQHKWQSDIDLIFIYQEHEPAVGLVNYFRSGIEVQYFYATLEALSENQKSVPYLLHMFAEGKILFDRYSTVVPVVQKIKAYFAAHPDIEADWLQIKELHQIEKKGPQCQQTTIMQRWDELEDKYSGGDRKRTFFRN